MLRSSLAVALLLAGCRSRVAGQALDSSCPPSGATAEALAAEITDRGLAGPPEVARFGLRRGDTVLILWKNLLSGRALTLSCAYLPGASAWRLVRARVDEGTHTLRLSAREDPPALIYRDAEGSLLEELEL